MSCEITRDDGLTDAEGVVADALVEAFRAFAALPRQHRDELRDFTDGIHRCQDQLMARIARRAFPKGWSNLERFNERPLTDSEIRWWLEERLWEKHGPTARGEWIMESAIQQRDSMRVADHWVFASEDETGNLVYRVGAT